MSKQLILFRHGKSDWEGDSVQDHDRPLAKRGIKAAQAMGQLLSRAEQVPDLVRSSTALRARSTAELAHTAGGWPCPLEFMADLYETTPQGVISMVKGVPDRMGGRPLDRLMLVGHEPTWSMLTALLMGGGRVEVPTAALVGIDLEIETWAAIGPGKGCLRWLFLPRLLT
ncbi:MAG: histidine phosphatase family protein [Prochlorothrix sp.]|nr:histidine phosphatase family protein [Prochlorothrix sp.]